jgi:hypothetical protein
MSNVHILIRLHVSSRNFWIWYRAFSYIILCVERFSTSSTLSIYNCLFICLFDSIRLFTVTV